MNLKNKKILITGSNGDIGSAIIEKLSMEGAEIGACVRKSDQNFREFIQRLVSKYKNKIEIIDFNLNNDESINLGCEKIKEKFNTIDCLINNAGINEVSLLMNSEMNNIKKLFQVNFFSHLLITKNLSKKMIKQKKGSIIFISSNAASVPFPGRLAYSTSKISLSYAAKILSKELGVFNIRVNSIEPGLTESKMARQQLSDEMIKTEIKKTSLKKIIMPKNIADLVEFLCSENSSSITGQSIKLDGGY